MNRRTIVIAAWSVVVAATSCVRSGLRSADQRADPSDATQEAPHAPPVASTDDADAVINPDLPEREDGVVPPEERGEGDATLRRRLHGDRDGVPVSMDVRLWRLGVPASARWTAGDQIQAAPTVAKDGVVIERLPPGRYRLQCLDPRDGAEDPPEFVVANGPNDVVAKVADRRTVHLRLLLVSVDGTPVRTAVRRSLGGFGSSWHDLPTPPPAWATTRSPTPVGGFVSRWHAGGNSCSLAEPRGKPTDAGPDGYFDLGTRIERGRGGQSEHGYTFVADACDVVEVQTTDAIDEDTTFVGLAVPLDVLVACVVRPSGEAIDSKTATVTARCDAVRLSWTPPVDAWRYIPVHVSVECEGFRYKEFTWTAATEDVPHELVPAAIK